MATHASAASPSRSRSESPRFTRGRSLFGLLLLLDGCGSREPSSAHLREGIEIGGRRLHPSVVEMIAERDGKEADEARQWARDRLLLTAASRAHRQDDEVDLPPEKAKELRSRVLATLWLKERFEAKHQPRDIPDSVVDSNIDDPSLSRKFFHPRVHFICQAIVVPAGRKENEGPTEAPNDETWRTQARAYLDPIVNRARPYRADFEKEEGCDLFFHLLRFAKEADDDPKFELRMESMGIDASARDQFSGRFLDQLEKVDETGVIEPFFTEYGLHWVFVPRILPSNLPSGSEPEKSLRQKRRDYLRHKLHPAWLKDRFREQLSKLEEKHVVRLRPELLEDPP